MRCHWQLGTSDGAGPGKPGADRPFAVVSAGKSVRRMIGPHLRVGHLGTCLGFLLSLPIA
jgi:hypothetical protein